ncbi:uncharacterized protein KGF55_005734 [Candida pseudojiufengensis]|uniref:uncharacterized protein n=1 Tax=Candida pseudojiufengensis TaxID=497109 RepID=UPI00222556DA|nr:uncharacterized protein KGF55_005734 [Candida pseudojiufengensis]KAI5958735.1 hypothetical protein KGF55_005734 [Candida pseudojiufengensis]
MSSITINNLLLDSVATSIASTVTPSLTNLHIATSIVNNDNEDSIDSDSIQTLSTTLSSIIESSISSAPLAGSGGILTASEESQLSDAKGTFAQSSDVKTLSLSGSGSNVNSINSNNNGVSLKGNNLIFLNLIFTFLLYLVSW